MNSMKIIIITIICLLPIIQCTHSLDRKKESYTIGNLQLTSEYKEKEYKEKTIKPILCELLLGDSTFITLKLGESLKSVHIIIGENNIYHYKSVDYMDGTGRQEIYYYRILTNENDTGSVYLKFKDNTLKSITVKFYENWDKNTIDSIKIEKHIDFLSEKYTQIIDKLAENAMSNRKVDFNKRSTGFISNSNLITTINISCKTNLVFNNKYGKYGIEIITGKRIKY